MFRPKMYFAASDRKCILLPPPFNPVRRWMGHGGKIHLGHRNEIGDTPIWMYQAMGYDNSLQFDKQISKNQNKKRRPYQHGRWIYDMAL